jgi:ubiquinone/menaquinone biosynthesis C-methylase UbiE
MYTLDSPLAVVRSVRPSLAGLRILDIGCGSGAFAGQLAAQGAKVTGIDPEPSAVRAAMVAVPGATFVEAVAEALPFEAATFDVAVMVNALHHVPPPAMRSALAEAGRVIKPDGVLVIVEPLPSGNFFEALRRVEDETVVRLAAQAAIEAAVLSGMLARTTTLDYVRREAFPTVDAFLERIVAVDPSRRDIVDRDKAAIVAAVQAATHRNDAGLLVFDQPIRADILRFP